MHVVNSDRRCKDVMERLRSKDPTLLSLGVLWNDTSEEIFRELWTLLSDPNISCFLQELAVGLNGAAPDDRYLILGSIDSILNRKTSGGGLECLNFSRFFSRIGDEGTVMLSKMLLRNDTLRELRLADNNIQAVGAHAIANALFHNQNLFEINLNNNFIDDSGCIAIAESLRHNSSLGVLSMESNGIGTKGAVAIAESLQENSSLVRLDLGHNVIGDEGCFAFAESLLENSSLQILHIRNSNIGLEGGRAIARTLSQNKTLRVLHLCENDNFPQEASIAVAKSLLHNSSLETLSMRKIDISVDGIKAIANALCHNTTLQTLDLTDAGVDDDGCIALANALCTNNRTLLNLLLRFNNIKINGAKAMAVALCQNDSLQKLDLWSNALTTEGCRILVNSLLTNSSLRSLLCWDWQGESPNDEIAKVLRQNHTLEEFHTSLPELKLYLYWNKTKGPVEAESRKTKVFPQKQLRTLSNYYSTAFFVEALAKVITFESLSVLYCLIRERPTFAMDVCLETSRPKKRMRR